MLLIGSHRPEGVEKVPAQQQGAKMGWVSLYLLRRLPKETATEWLLREGFALLKRGGAEQMTK